MEMTRDAIALKLLGDVLRSSNATDGDCFDTGEDVAVAFEYADSFLAQSAERVEFERMARAATVSVQDAIADGQCESGVRAWLAQHADGRGEMNGWELYILGLRYDPDGKGRIERIIRRAVKRAALASVIDGKAE